MSTAFFEQSLKAIPRPLLAGVEGVSRGRLQHALTLSEVVRGAAVDNADAERPDSLPFRP